MTNKTSLSAQKKLALELVSALDEEVTFWTHKVSQANRSLEETKQQIGSERKILIKQLLKIHD